MNWFEDETVYMKNMKIEYVHTSMVERCSYCDIPKLRKTSIDKCILYNPDLKYPSCIRLSINKYAVPVNIYKIWQP